jgi:hypothetical protein
MSAPMPTLITMPHIRFHLPIAKPRRWMAEEVAIEGFLENAPKWVTTGFITTAIHSECNVLALPRPNRMNESEHSRYAP